jgi:DNA primase
MQETTAQFIPDEKIREIRETSSIVEVISDFIALKKVGINYKGLCPFHNEKTPSFYVNDIKRFFHCFGCGTSGDVFAFLMKHDNLSFAEAARQLAKRYGIHLPEKPLNSLERQRLSERESFFKINEAVALLYHRLLLEDGRAAAARQYLASRGLGADIIREHCIGFAPDSWDTVVQYLKSTSFSPGLAAKLGLIVSKGGGQYYDRFRNRILFPIWNVSRNIIGFGGRVIGQGEPKYLNSPESVVYNKRHNLYGLQSAGHHIQKDGRAIIVEGYLDALTLHQAGIKNTVAALGTALTENQIQLLKRYSTDIITVFDADQAGEKAMARSLEPFLKNGVSPRVIVLPKGEDPDSFVRQQGGAAFQEKIAGASFLLEFVIERIIARHDISSPPGKVAACDEIVPLLGQIADSLERDLYEQQVARRIGISQAQIGSRGPARPDRKAVPEAARPQKESATGSAGSAELLIIKLLVANPEFLNSIDWNIFEDFTQPDLKDLGVAVAEMYRGGGMLDISQLSESIAEPSQKQLLARVAFFENQPEEPVKALEDCIRTLYLKKLAEEAKRISSGIKQAEAARDEAAVIALQQRHLQLKTERQKWFQFKLR